MNRLIWTGLFLFLVEWTMGQETSTATLDTVTIKGIRTVNGVGHFTDVKEGVIYAGKKNEVIITDSLDANKAINNTRQLLGRIPGLVIVETESSGFTANGIATRGLNPTQSIEMNTRQNGYTISADVYGYNEAYYLPPMEAVNRIEMVRGAAALQFGAQFGGLVNYVIKEGATNKAFEYTGSQTMGSYGLFTSFHSAGGHYKRWHYYAYLQYRHLEGYRPNSRQLQVSGYGKVQYDISSRWKAGVEYSLLRNRIQMPGGLTDSMFKADPRQSTRARNWLKSPWNVIAATVSYQPSAQTTLRIQSTYLFSSRSLVWRNEDGGPEALDTINPATLAYDPREVEKEDMHSTSTEVRLSHEYRLGQVRSVFSGGVRGSYGWFVRKGGGEGTTGSDFDLSIRGDWEYNLDFTTTNVGPFAENLFQVTPKLSVTPGFRMEYLRTTARGYKTEDRGKLPADETRSRYIPLAGVGVEYRISRFTQLYANMSQAYRPIEYSQLEPFGVTSRVDPGLKDAYGYNADLGYRGVVGSYLNFDISGFYLSYRNRVGVVLETDPVSGQEYTMRTNVANSVHKGLEGYVEFNLWKYLHPGSTTGLSVFSSFAFIDARYASGPYRGNRVEASSRIVDRTGLIFHTPRFSVTFQYNYTGDAYGDASNARVSSDPVAGYLPSYTVLDLSASYRWKQVSLKAGVNNLGDKAYFTRRTDEYPGPGIIPAAGRSLYAGITVRL